MKFNVLKKSILVFSACFISFSCSDDDSFNTKDKFSIQKFALSENQVNNIGKQIKDIQQIGAISKMSQKQLNYEAEIILQPMVDSGQEIHDEMLNFLERSGELDNLSESEINQISNLTDEQLIELSFISYNQYQYTNSSVDWGQVRSCASFALGIQGIRSLYTNTLALGTVETMIGALKLIGKRYLGCIGVALMIYDFADCLYE